MRATRVKQGATLGANATIVCGNTIGRYAFVGAGTVVTSDVPDYALFMGNPGRLKGWMCACGTRLRFEAEKAQCPRCGTAYIKEGAARIRDLYEVISRNASLKSCGNGLFSPVFLSTHTCTVLRIATTSPRASLKS